MEEDGKLFIESVLIIKASEKLEVELEVEEKKKDFFLEEWVIDENT